MIGEATTWNVSLEFGVLDATRRVEPLVLGDIPPGHLGFPAPDTRAEHAADRFALLLLRRHVIEKRAVQIGAMAWAMVAFIVAGASLGEVSTDALMLVGAASVVLPLAAFLAAIAAAHDQLRVAGALLVLSSATPTYFAWVLNIPALLAGLMLLAAPGVIVKRSRQHQSGA